MPKDGKKFYVVRTMDFEPLLLVALPSRHAAKDVEDGLYEHDSEKLIFDSGYDIEEVPYFNRAATAIQHIKDTEE